MADALENRLKALEASIDSLPDAFPPLALPTTPYLLYFESGARARQRQSLTIMSSAIGETLHQVDTILQRLGSFRTTLHQQHAAIDNALAPINALPIELLHSIFYAAVAQTEGFHNGVHTASSISQVSRQWNAIATSAPLLWADFSMLRDIEPRYPIPLLNKALERSGRAPRSLRLDDQSLCQWPKNLLYDKFVRDALRTLSISDGSQHEASFLGQYSVLDHDFLILETLEISLDRAPTAQEPRWFDFNAFGAPLLSHLTLQDLRIDSLSLVGESLCVLHLSRVGLDDVWDTLTRHCPCLERLTLTNCPRGELLPTKTMPTLEYLEVDDLEYEGSDREAVLPIIMPSLRHLCLRAMGNTMLKPVDLIQYSTQARSVQMFEVHYDGDGIFSVVQTLGKHPDEFPALYQLGLFRPDDVLSEEIHDSQTLCDILKAFVKSRLPIPSIPASAVLSPIKNLTAPSQVLAWDWPWFEDSIETIVGQSWSPYD